MKKILITGAGGMLGNEICRRFASSGKYEIIAATRSSNSYIRADKYLIGDLTRKDYVESLSESQIDAIIHCAAMTDIEMSEREPETAFLINTKATENLAKTFAQAIFIYVSTDSVFDGKRGNYSETDVSDPLNVYARTKLEGENAVGNYNKNHYIIRTNIYGFHRPLAERSLFEWAYQKLSRGEQVKGFTNVFFNPLYVGQLALIAEKFVEQIPSFGIYNAVSDGHLSKYGFLQKAIQLFNFLDEQLIPYETSQRPVLAFRPFRTYLKNDKLKAAVKGVDLSMDSGLEMLRKDLFEFQKHNQE